MVATRHEPPLISWILHRRAVATLVDYQSVGGGTPRNVALFRFNPETGLIFLDRGTGETDRPTFVAFHVQRLILVQKHNEAYSHREIDIAAVYNLWGITTSSTHSLATRPTNQPNRSPSSL